MDLLKKVMGIKEGSKVTISVETIFGGISKAKATYLGNLRQHGYITKSGSWCLYDSNGKFGETPCYWIDVRLYKSKKKMPLQLEFRLKDIENGWED